MSIMYVNLLILQGEYIMNAHVDDSILNMTFHLTPGSLTSDKVWIKGQRYLYRCFDGLQIGDSVRVTGVSDGTVALEKLQRNN